MTQDKLKLEIEKAIENNDRNELVALVESAWGNAEAMATVAEFVMPKQETVEVVTHTTST